MTRDKFAELQSEVSLAPCASLSNSDTTAGMQQLVKDEQKFFSDLGGSLVKQNVLPQLAVELNHDLHQEKKDEEHSPHQGNCRKPDFHDTKQGESQSDQHSHHKNAHGLNRDLQRESHRSAGSRQHKLTAEQFDQELNEDIFNLSTDLSDLVRNGGIDSASASSILQGFKKVEDSAESEYLKELGADSRQPAETQIQSHPRTDSGSGLGSQTRSDSTSTSGSQSNAESSSVGSSQSSSNPPSNTESGSTGATSPGSVETSDPQKSPDSIPTSGRFTVKNGLLYDPSGKEFIANGICVDSNQASTEVDQLVDQDHFNFMRIGYSDMVNKDGSPNFAMMDQLAKTYASKGVPVEFEYPITDNQMVYTGSDLQKAENWYSQVAAHFKDNPYVFLATPNESGDGSTNNSQWLAQTEGILKAVSATGNENPIVVDDTQWSNAAISGDPSSSELIKNAKALESISPNIIAGEHDYSSAGESQAASNLSKGLEALRQAGYTPMIQEFGVYNTGNPNSDQSGVDAVLSDSTMKSGVGYVGYVDTYGYSAQSERSVAGPNDQDALILPDGSLTKYGQQVVASNSADQAYLKEESAT